MNKKESAAKSLRWLANNFPFISPPADNMDRMSNAIHVYATSGADQIEALEKRVKELEEEIKQYDYLNAVKEVISQCDAKGRGIVKRRDTNGSVTLWLEAEWVTLGDGTNEVIELMMCYSDTGKIAYSSYIEETKRKKAANA